MKTQIESIFTLLSTDATLQTLLSGTATDKAVYVDTPDQIERFPCIIMKEISSSFRTSLYGAEDSEYQFDIYSKTSYTHTVDIYVRLNFLLNYYKQATTAPRIVFIKQTNAFDAPESDRRLFRKVTRYQLWSQN